MAEALNDVTMQSAVACDTCENLAEHLCKTCHDKLCIRCKDIHRKSKSSFDHKITQLTFESLSLLSETPSVQECRSHPGFRANVCCKECEIPVCEKCLISKHNGHKLTSTEELFREKKKKLEEKFSFMESELPKYETEIENLSESEKKNEKSRETMQNEIVSHFKEAREKLDAEEKRLLQIAQAQHQLEQYRLQTQNTSASEYTNITQKFMTMFRNENLSERYAFILYSNTSSISEKVACFPPRLTLQFTKGKLDDNTLVQMSGTISSNIAAGCLVQTMLEQDDFQVGTSLVETLTYQLNDDTFWVFLKGDSSFKKCNRSGIILDEIGTTANKALNKPICIFPNGMVIFRKSDRCLAKVHNNKEEIDFYDSKDSIPVCVYVSGQNMEIAVAIVNFTVSEGKISKFNTCGQCLNEIRNKLLFRNLIGSNKRKPIKIAENINGDVYISNTEVDAFDKTGNFRFSYAGVGNTKFPFHPRDICTDIMGNILIADEENCCIHVLDIDGQMQKLYDVHVSSGKDTFHPITLAIDANHCLCVGCSDGKIRVFKYIEWTC